MTAILVSGAPTSQSQSSITKLSGVFLGQKLARVEPRAIEHRIMTLPWIESTDISRHWLSGQVEIAVTPRTPTAYFNQATIDNTGTIFTLPGFAGGELPQVKASTTSLGLPAIELFNHLPQIFKTQVQSLSVRNESNFALQISFQNRDIQVIWGDKNEIELKVEVIQALLAMDENKNIKWIDVTAPHAPIVK